MGTRGKQQATTRAWDVYIRNIGVKGLGADNGVGWVSPSRCCDATSALLLEAADEVFLVLVDKGRDSNNEPGADTKLQ